MSGLNEAPQASGWLGCLSYRSTATSRPSAAELAMLASEARSRNRSLGVTGMLLFDDGQFFQTLEGPPEGLEAIWTSVEHDPRHRNIEVLSQHLIPTRLFSDWDLLLYDRSGASPQRAAGPSTAPVAVDRYVHEMVQLALNADDLRINGLIAALAQKGWTNESIVALIIEPAARALGDAWLADRCSEIDLTIALSMLQLAGHAAHHHAALQPLESHRYTVLLATAPGEPHMLGASLLADQFNDAGWQVDMAFPSSEDALLNQLSAQQPDALDIGLSDALPRDHAVAGLREAIKHARVVARHHPTVISVGGRLFAEAAATAASVGADHARKSVVGSSVRIAELVRRQRLC